MKTNYFKTRLLFLAALVFISVLMSIAIGSNNLHISYIIDYFQAPSIERYENKIIDRRIIRTIFSVMCGIALGVSGALMQSVTRNPIADPSILGVNTGAALAIVIGFTFFNINSSIQYIIFAMVGAMIAAIIVFGVSSIGRSGMTPVKLVLCGAAASAIFSSLLTVLLLMKSQVADQYRFWQVGSVGFADIHSIQLFAPFLVIGLLIAIIYSPALNAIALGDETATALGVRTTTLRFITSIAAVLLCGAATAFAGPIMFIGLLATHLSRLLFGHHIKSLIIFSAVLGGSILTIADVVGRVLGRPGELEVGVMTAFVGAPLLIFLAVRMKVSSI